MQVRKKPVVVEAITFEELVAHGLAEIEKDPKRKSTVINGMPWSFEYKGHPITHENDNCYIVPTLEGSLHFKRGDYLITGVKGEIYPIKKEIFDETYEIVGKEDPDEVRKICIDLAYASMHCRDELTGSTPARIAVVGRSMESIVRKVLNR